MGRLPGPYAGTRRAALHLFMGVTLFAGAGCSLAPIDLAKERALPLRTTIYAADGSKLARLYRQNRALVRISQMPQPLIDAVLAAEDARFYTHEGFDLKAIVRAALVNAREGEIAQGGSTITQQYVKNTYFRKPQRTFERKAKELRLAIEIEKRYSKDEILERYLNAVYLGSGAYGVKAAAETFFRKHPSRLTVAESALLAAVIKAPALYDPIEHPKAARVRRNYVLRRMVALGKIPRSRARKAVRAPLGAVEDPPRIATRQPYFVEAVKQEVLEDARLGPDGAQRADALWKGGLEIETTLDLELQRAAERSVAKILNQPGDPSAALVAIRPRSGAIVAMVGGRDWSSSQVNLALGRAGGGSGRQPGSTFKPIVAAAAMEQGISLDTRYESSPGLFTASDGSTWTVRNAEGGGSGLLPLGEAMVRSVNGVYARLGLQLGAEQVRTQARLMGIEAPLPAHPSIALGAGEVSVLDMAAAYATLANHGDAVEPTTIERITLANGQVFESEQEHMREVVSPGNSYLLTKVLEQVITRGTGKAADIGRPAAGKTGTTNDYADAWFVGYTPQLVTAVWVGYPQGRVPMTSVHGIRVFGGTFPALIWSDFMRTAHEGVPVTPFEIPKSDLVTVLIDPVSGLLAASWCEGVPRTMLRQLVPTGYCPVPPPPPPPSPSPLESPSPSPSPTGKTSPSPSPTGKTSPSPSPSPEPSPSRKGGDGKKG